MLATHNDKTTEYLPFPAPAGEARGCARVAVVQGSGPNLSNELLALRRMRLRAAALILFIGFGLFLIWRILFEPRLAGLSHAVIEFLHVAAVVILGACTVILRRPCPYSARALTWAEMLIFGMSAGYFILLTTVQLTDNARRGFAFNPSVPWLLLIFTYGTFIPNRWQKTAPVVASLALFPIGIAAYLRATDAAFAAVWPFGDLVGLAMMLGVGALASAYGSYLIGSLRREAFEAKQLGQYRLRNLIGAGGMGEVYYAEHQLLKRPCAIKLIQPKQATDPMVLARFEREVQATAQLSHWNTVEIFDFGRTDDGTFYYVMEYLPGMSLDALVERYGPLEPERAIHFLRQACQALREAHQMGMIHRDIKPSNLFAAQRGGYYDVTKLLDFGLVKPMSEVKEGRLTRDGTVSGTPWYMSPEQALGNGQLDARSDIYSLGATTYYLLTGRAPFDDNNALTVLIAHARDAVEPPSRHNPRIPDDLEHIVLRCLEKKPDNRFQSAEELESALIACGQADRWTSDRAEHWWRNL